MSCDSFLEGTEATVHAEKRARVGLGHVDSLLVPNPVTDTELQVIELLAASDCDSGHSVARLESSAHALVEIFF